MPRSRRNELLAAVDRVRALEPKRICPQHGSIIDKDIEAYLDAVSRFQVGRMLPAEEEAAG